MNEDSPATAPAASEAALQLLRSRRTVHEFLATPVADAVIERAIECARWAPNHYRTEPWRFYLLGPAARAILAERNAAQVRAAQGARAAEVKLQRWQAMPGWLLLTCPRSDDAVREREDYAACCCAAQNLMLALWAEGIGVKWSTGGITRDGETLSQLGIDHRSETVVGLFWYGVPAAVTAQQRRPLAQILAHLA